MKNSKYFIQAFEATNKNEGWYSNHPKDRGGETLMGVARNFWPRLEMWEIVDSYKRKANFPNNMRTDSHLHALIKQFYFKEFWHKMKLDALNHERISLKLYDMGMNMGHKIAIILFQRALNLTNRNQRDYKDISVDGAIGNETLNAFRSNKDKDVLFKVINVLHGSRYIDIAERNKTQEEFINGWFGHRIAMVHTMLKDTSNIA